MVFELFIVALRILSNKIIGYWTTELLIKSVNSMKKSNHLECSDQINFSLDIFCVYLNFVHLLIDATISEYWCGTMLCLSQIYSSILS